MEIILAENRHEQRDYSAGERKDSANSIKVEVNKYLNGIGLKERDVFLVENRRTMHPPKHDKVRQRNKMQPRRRDDNTRNTLLIFRRYEQTCQKTEEREPHKKLEKFCHDKLTIAMNKRVNFLWSRRLCN